MEVLLDGIARASGNTATPLADLIAALRPRPGHTAEAPARLAALCVMLEGRPDLAAGLREHLLRVVGTRRQAHLYADTGIFDGTGFFTELRQRLGWKLLPPVVNDAHLKDVFGTLFPRPDDHEWIAAIDDDLWLRLLDAMRNAPAVAPTSDAGQPLPSGSAPPPGERTLREVLEALSTLSHRLTALGLDPNLVQVYPAIESYESPFLALQAEIASYVRAWRALLDGQRSRREDAAQALVLVAQCRDTLARIRRRAPETGISIRLTQLLVRLAQTLRRIETLFGLLESRGHEQRLRAIRFLKELVEADNRKTSLREVLATHTSLLALRVTDNAGQTGEHYVTVTRREYFAMLRSGLGAGLIVGFMALLKVLAGKLSLAPIGQALVYSLNYSLGFMLVHMLHFTIATKQPAMTAARIAASIQEVESSRERDLGALADLCVNVFRTQFIAISGNVLLALPTAMLLAWAWLAATGAHLADPGKVAQMLHDLDPVSSLALFHAAIAGVCLFLAGLISGYYDNKAVHSRIPDRLRQRALLRRVLGEERLDRFAAYVGDNLGALAGNFWFGVMLGSMGTVGFILGLPLDIRHITFSSAYLGFAVVGSDFALPAGTLALVAAGVIGIGLVNLSVSFGLALLVALRARGVTWQQWPPLLGLILERFRRQPLRFFWPPRDVPSTPPANNSTTPGPGQPAA
ncbi:MAG: site-specific recombinase [Pseudomonadota bacterium]